jgi:hypothetical protein
MLRQKTARLRAAPQAACAKIRAQETGNDARKIQTGARTAADSVRDGALSCTVRSAHCSACVRPVTRWARPIGRKILSVESKTHLRAHARTGSSHQLTPRIRVRTWGSEGTPAKSPTVRRARIECTQRSFPCATQTRRDARFGDAVAPVPLGRQSPPLVVFARKPSSGLYVSLARSEHRSPILVASDTKPS